MKTTFIIVVLGLLLATGCAKIISDSTASSSTSYDAIPDSSNVDELTGSLVIEEPSDVGTLDDIEVSDGTIG
ncbi:MAG: hypothetical protein ACP5NV_04550 [Candidatus Woesearchaeota archaeon]